CATASAIYVINDLSDLKADRVHPRKRYRPFASGAVSAPLGAVIAAALLVVGGFFAVQSSAAVPIALYAVISLSYSMWLKELPLVDVFVLATLYTLRLFAGGQATHHPVSLWL